MSYTALYRQWRPTVFDDVIGQEHIITTLKNGVVSGRISHAYLFTGTHGTGKTSTAKIFARAVNCVTPKGGNPCNECDICKSILSGSLLDVIEIDAASNNGVDNVREIREEANYCPSRAKYKVYIIDEVHMLSSGAFNALLKTLEEPPAHVIFILATTEPHKLPATILSRCQRYDFHRVPAQDIVKRIMHMAQNISIQIDEEAATLIARISEGSMRDAISLFDQTATLDLEKITYNDVLNVAGIVDDESISSIVDNIYIRDVHNILRLIDEIVSEGKSVSKLVYDIIVYFRNMLVVSIAGDDTDLLVLDNRILNKMKEQVKLYSKEVLIKIIQQLSEILVEIKKSDCPKVLLEMSLLQLCTFISNNGKAELPAKTMAKNKENTENKSDVSRKVAEEQIINNKGDNGAAKQTAKKDNQPTKDDSIIEKKLQEQKQQIDKKVQNIKNDEYNQHKESEFALKKDDSDNKNEDECSDEIFQKQLLEKWGDVMQVLKKNRKSMLYYNLEDTEIKVIRHGLLAIIFKINDTARKDIVSQPANIKALQEAVLSVIGSDVKITCLLEKEKYKDDGFMEKAKQFTERLGISVSIIDE